MQKKFYIYIAHFYTLWIDESEITYGPLLPQRKQNQWGYDEPGSLPYKLLKSGNGTKISDKK